MLLLYIPEILLANLIGPNSITQPVATLKPGRSHCFIPLISLFLFPSFFFLFYLLSLPRTKGDPSNELCLWIHYAISACRTARARSCGSGNQVQSIGNVKNHFFYLAAFSSSLSFFFFIAPFSFFRCRPSVRSRALLCLRNFLSRFLSPSLIYPLTLCRSKPPLSLSAYRSHQRICPIDRNHVSSQCIIMATL